jgi:hypothetical protein
VTIENPHSNIKIAAAANVAGWPEKVPTFLLPLKRDDCCLRRPLHRTFALKRDLNRPSQPRLSDLTLNVHRIQPFANPKATSDEAGCEDG